MLVWMWKVIKLGSKLACLIHVLRIVYILRYIFYLLHISLVIQQRFLWTIAILRKDEAICSYFLPVVDLCYQKEKKKSWTGRIIFLLKVMSGTSLRYANYKVANFWILQKMFAFFLNPTNSSFSTRMIHFLTSVSRQCQKTWPISVEFRIKGLFSNSRKTDFLFRSCKGIFCLSSGSSL